MNRRSFLRLTALGSGSFLVPTVLSAAGSTVARKTPNERITVGLIGCGGQGRADMSQALASANAQVIAVCDVNASHAQDACQQVEKRYAAEKASGSFKGCDVYRDFREILARPDLDAVIIGTPDHWHALTMIAAVNAGKDVYVEKPLATSIPESRAMAEAVRRTGAVVQVGGQQRSSAYFQRGVELVRNGLLGKISKVSVALPQGRSEKGGPFKTPLAQQSVPADFDYDFWLGPAPFVPYYKERCDWNWRWSFDYGGGQVTDWVSHHYDIAIWAMGLNTESPVEILNAKAEFGPPSPLFNTATKYEFQARYANGQVIDVSSGGGTGVRFEGENGWVECSRSGVIYSGAGIRQAIIPSDGFRCGVEGQSHMENFLSCIRSRTVPIHPVEDAHHAASMAHLANAAFRSGVVEVKFDRASEQVVGNASANALLRRAYRAPWVLPS
jgi:predicted dehydrogenase